MNGRIPIGVVNYMTARNEILNVLKTGKNVTAEQLAKKTGINGVSQRIAELRRNGYPNIYTNTITVKGERVNAYRLGTPTKAMRKAAKKGSLALAK